MHAYPEGRSPATAALSIAQRVASTDASCEFHVFTQHDSKAAVLAQVVLELRGMADDKTCGRANWVLGALHPN